MILTALYIATSGTRGMRWLLRAHRGESRWKRSPTWSAARMQVPVFAAAMFIYGSWFDWSLLTEWSAEAHRWRRIAYATGLEVILLFPILWVKGLLVNGKIARLRGPGTLELLGTVLDVPSVVGEVGEPRRRITFTLEADDGVRWVVESDPTQHWPKASLAAGWTAHRLAPTHPQTLAWRGLRPGERVWIVGAVEAPDPLKRLTILRDQGLLIRGGPAAAYTSFGFLVGVAWLYMIWMQPLAWNLASIIDLSTY